MGGAIRAGADRDEGEVRNCGREGQRGREGVLGADDWDASMGDWDPERYCSQKCARAEERRAARLGTGGGWQLSAASALRARAVQ